MDTPNAQEEPTGDTAPNFLSLPFSAADGVEDEASHQTVLGHALSQNNNPRQSAPNRELPASHTDNGFAPKPYDTARQAMPEHEKPMRHTATGLDEDSKSLGERARPDAAVGSTKMQEESGNANPPSDNHISETPPDHADLVTVEGAVTLFREAGLPRHIRTIQKYCARVKGRALICYQTPTENGIRYMIEKASIERFILDATQQAPTGALEGEPEAMPAKGRSSEQISTPADLDIFEHPYVKRLEGQIVRLEDKNDRLQGEVQNVLERANEGLIELQKASAVAQSESLGTFLLEAERIRNDAPQTDAESATPPVDTGQRHAPEYGV